MKPAAFLKAGVLMGLAIVSAMPTGGILAPSIASAQEDVRQEDRRTDRQQDSREDRKGDRQNDRREDRRADRGGRGR